jgi:hypothetical protein
MEKRLSEWLKIVNMSEIIVRISKNTNYIYHMLSVSKCGYENQYGKKYKNIHNKTDLEILKKYEEFLTVEGGSHFGRLYNVFVSTPAAIEEDSIFLNYFEGLKDLFSNNNPVENYEKYKEVYQTAYAAHRFVVTQQSSIDFYNYLADIKKSILEICDILINNYSTYNENVWESSIEKLETKKVLLQEQLSSDVDKKWEKILNHKYPFDKFEVLLCNSISGGAQAVDIAYNKDVFDSEMDVNSIVQYISHEIGIYILRDKLAKEDIDFNSNYDVIESVIEYYNPIKNKRLVFGRNFNQIIEHIKQILRTEPSLSLVEVTKRIINKGSIPNIK